MKLLTLNLWRYYNFAERLPALLSAIMKKSPDVICLQEVQIDKNHSPFSQVEILKNNLTDYKYSIHSTVLVKTHQQGKELDQPVQHGMAVLSKYPIIHSFNYYLELQKDEKEQRSVLAFDILKEDTIEKFANIHFGNNSAWSYSQLKEFLAYLSERNEQRIMAGDFNSPDLVQYHELLHEYTISYNFKPYISLPTGYEDGKIVQKNWTLDYVLLPKKYQFLNLEVTQEYLSDHNGIFVEFE